MDQALVPIVLVAAALLVGWVMYGQNYGFRRQLAAIRRAQGVAAAEAIEEEARYLMALGWREPQAYVRAIEIRVQKVGAGVKVETERRVRASSQKAAAAHDEHEQRKTETRLRVMVKHQDGIVPGQGPLVKTPSHPPGKNAGKDEQAPMPDASLATDG